VGDRSFLIPDDFRALVRDIVAKLDFGDDPGSVVGARAFEAECGFGGRVEGRDLFRFQYIANGGETKPSNLVSLCRFHHRAVHEEGVDVHVPMTARCASSDRTVSPCTG